MDLGKFVVVRTRHAGVHCGTLVAQDGIKVSLKNAVRLWRWKGANTLSEVAIRGCDMEYTRISEPVSLIDLSEAIEVIATTPEAQTNLSLPRWGK